MKWIYVVNKHIPAHTYTPIKEERFGKYEDAYCNFIPISTVTKIKALTEFS